ncbi:putative addiction module antidote protein [Candidatus Babeliales bacterium]|nr:putative addiction module antidote protein [Candidatus Babeliales bacterium]
MNKRIKDYQERLLQDLQDPSEAQAYLNAALLDEDPRIFLIALKNVIDAQNQAMSELAKKTNLNRENLYRAFSSRGNPKISTIIPILNALGLQLAIQPYNHK